MYHQALMKVSSLEGNPLSWRGLSASVGVAILTKASAIRPRSRCPKLRHVVRGRGLLSVTGSVLPGRGLDRPDGVRRREGRRPKAVLRRSPGGPSADRGAGEEDSFAAPGTGGLLSRYRPPSARGPAALPDAGSRTGAGASATWPGPVDWPRHHSRQVGATRPMSARPK